MITPVGIFILALIAQGIIGAGLVLSGLSPVMVLPLLLTPVLVFFLTRKLYEQSVSARRVAEHDAVEARREIQNVRLSANKDPLTGLNSRHYVRERLDELLSVATNRGHSLAVLYLDIDYFKEFNEALGHTLGNRILTQMAQRLNSLLKKGDLLGYYGGDEFIIVLPVLHDMMAAEMVARRIFNAMTNPILIDHHQLQVSLSIGIAMGPVDATDSESLLRRAESALKDSKSKGRNAYSFYSQSLNQSASERLKMDQLLRGALERNEFSIVYQAIVSEQGTRLKGFEALIRWSSPELGQVSPSVFIPIAEQIGLISEIGLWVLRESAEQLKLWQSRYDQAIVMSINVSPRQFHDESILPAVKGVISKTGLPPASLQLEVTEGLFLSASERTLNNIRLLKSSGIRLALDDFGTGFSSLSYLNQLPFDVLKIDKSFVDGLENNDKDQAMVMAIISIAHRLSMEVVVEGVETPQQVHVLRELSADALQGYYYSKPVSAREAEARFLSQSGLLNLSESIWDELS
ncbi:putative bifunctional diguanylate cyclase/phosphodiesterase [Reinekea blandensis]|uniref:Sensory box/GGDEF family protein n=1 Tax=Reinekea blandensis MED297 TaxID=314283 RepID=A4BH36_9GAMM|nr:EAL domain-containing protein [Reinekea blandensis]EAR08535.1 sensory box/GGDEF family protein [Reinekea sp. MED297] [Reinekea blandensis MED297]